MGDRGESSAGRRPPSVFWPVILIIAGLLFLLDNLGVLHVDFWQLWRLWPILLILAGLDILLARRSWLGNLIVLVLTIAVIGGVVLLLVTNPGVLGPSLSGGVERISEPLGDIERADLKVSFAAGQLTIDRLADSSSLIEGKLGLATEAKPVWTVERSGDRASLGLGYKEGTQSWGEGDRWDLHMSPKASFSLNVDVGAGGATLDLTGLAIRDLKVKAGAGQTTVIFPAEGQFSAEVDGAVGALVIEIPEGMAARLQIDRGLSAITVSDRFKKTDQGYVTGDWATNDNRMEVKITVGVGLVTIREP